MAGTCTSILYDLLCELICGMGIGETGSYQLTKSFPNRFDSNSKIAIKVRPSPGCFIQMSELLFSKFKTVSIEIEIHSQAMSPYLAFSPSIRIICPYFNVFDNGNIVCSQAARACNRRIFEETKYGLCYTQVKDISKCKNGCHQHKNNGTKLREFEGTC